MWNRSSGVLPHRAPFLIVERISDIVLGQSAIGWKAVTFNEPHFAGHFPDYAVMPGVLIIEAMAQTAGALVVHTLGLQDQQRGIFHDHRQSAFPPAGASRRRAAHARAGDTASRRRSGALKARLLSDDELCAEAEYSAMLTGQATERSRRAAVGALNDGQNPSFCDHRRWRGTGGGCRRSDLTPSLASRVSLAAGVRIDSHVVISGATRIGDGTVVHSHSAIGGPPQFRGDPGTDARLVIGAGNVIREHVTINGGSVKGGGLTQSAIAVISCPTVISRMTAMSAMA